MQIKKLFKDFDRLQKIYGDKNLDPVYGGGQIKNPNFFLIFMNPTARNISSYKSWEGLKVPWIATKNIWKMFYELGFFDKGFYEEIYNKKASDWDYEFANKVYKIVANNSIYITNLSKATQIDARPLKNEIFRQYLDLIEKEINIIKPQKIVTFGNQVSSVFLNKNIKVSEHRKRAEIIEIKGHKYNVYPVYYPVGQGMRNMKKAKEDLNWIRENC